MEEIPATNWSNSCLWIWQTRAQDIQSSCVVLKNVFDMEGLEGKTDANFPAKTSLNKRVTLCWSFKKDISPQNHMSFTWFVWIYASMCCNVVPHEGEASQCDHLFMEWPEAQIRLGRSQFVYTEQFLNTDTASKRHVFRCFCRFKHQQEVKKTNKKQIIWFLAAKLSALMYSKQHNPHMGYSKTSYTSPKMYFCRWNEHHLATTDWNKLRELLLKYIMDLQTRTGLQQVVSSHSPTSISTKERRKLLCSDSNWELFSASFSWLCLEIRVRYPVATLSAHWPGAQPSG